MGRSRITVWRRKKSRWTSTEAAGGQRVSLGHGEIAVDDVYAVLKGLS